MYKKHSLTLITLAFIFGFIVICTYLINKTNSKYDIYTTVNINSFSTDVDYYAHPMCVSLVRNGEQLILDSNVNFDTYYRDVYPENINERDIKTIYAKDYYDKSSSGYEALKDEYVIEYTGKKSPIKSTVKYIDYSDDNNSPDNVWADYIYDNYNDIFKTTSPIKIEIKDAYLYDDGKNKISIINVAVFKNVEEYTKIKEKNNINEKGICYYISMILVNDKPHVYIDNDIESYDYDKYYNTYLFADIDRDNVIEIIKCNEYMVKNSDFIICFVKYSWGV